MLGRYQQIPITKKKIHQLDLKEVRDLLKLTQDSTMFFDKLGEKTIHQLMPRSAGFSRGIPRKMIYKYTVTNWPNFPLQDDALSAVSIVEGSLRAQQKALMEKYRQDKEAEQALKDQEGKKKEKEKEKPIPGIPINRRQLGGSSLPTGFGLQR